MRFKNGLFSLLLCILNVIGLVTFVCGFISSHYI